MTIGEMVADSMRAAAESFTELQRKFDRVMPALRKAADRQAAVTAFGEKNPNAQVGGIGIDPDSITLNDRAVKIQTAAGCDFGEALRRANEVTFAEQTFTPGLTPAKIEQVFGPDSKDMNGELAREAVQKIMRIYQVDEPVAQKLYLQGIR